MKTHTQQFKNAIKTFGRELDSKVIYGNVELSGEQLNSISPHYQGGILKSVMKELEIDSNVEIPAKTILTYKLGVKTGSTYEYIDFGNYVVKSVEKQEDTGSYLIKCCDKMLYSMKEYKALDITYPISIRDYINALCQNLGLVFADNNKEFANYNKLIKQDLYKDLGYTYRDIFDELSQATAGTICLNNQDQVEIRYINDTKDTIDEEFLKDINVNFEKKYGVVNSIVLSRSGQSDNVYLRDEKSVAKDGLCEIKIVDNQIMNFNDRSDYLVDILGKIDGLTYYLNDFSSTGVCYYDLCDKYNVKIGDKTYSCIMFNDEINITQGLEENIYTEMPEDSETDYTKADKTDRKINQAYLIVDKQNQVIESVIKNETEQNQKISSIQQTVNELNSKIKDIADITISGETSYGTIDLNNINKSEPIYLKVRPTATNISFLYPYTNLYPSNNLYMSIRKIAFYNKTTKETIMLEIPDDLLYLDNQNYDELILDYDSKTLMINKKLKYNSDGKVAKLDKPVIKNYDYPKLQLESGDYSITALGYNDVYIFARLMAENIYTTQFATKVEVESNIKQTATEINLSVDKKIQGAKNEMSSDITQTANEINLSVDKKIEATKEETSSEIKQTANAINLEVSKKVGNDEVISKINQTPETIAIEANKVNIKGVINAVNSDKTTTINGNKITTGTIKSEQIATNGIIAENIKTDAITTDKIKAGAVNATKVSADIITTKNFSAQKINADNITAGTLTGRAISGGSVNGAKITGGSIAIQRGNYYFNMGTGTNHPNCSGLNVARDINMNGIGFSSDGARFNFSNEITVPYLKVFNQLTSNTDSYLYGQVHLNNIVAGGVINLRSGGSKGSATGGGILIRSRGGHISLDSTDGGSASGHYVYARGSGVSNARVKTDSGSASSRNTKTNFEKFNDLKYKKALDLLKDINIYSYDYIYNLYENRHQYGFIIDEIEKLKDYQEFFDFRKEKAKVINKDELDFCVEDNDKDTIEVQKYNPDTLDKYLLTCIKAQQQEIEELKREIEELKSMI